MASENGKVDGTELLKYVVSECAHFFSNLVYSLEAAVARGELPQRNSSYLKELPKGKEKKEVAKQRVKRKPSAYNIYVQKKCEQLKAAGTSDHSASWKALSEEQKKAYTALFLANNSDPSLDKLPEPEEVTAVAAALPQPAAEQGTDEGDGESEIDDSALSGGYPRAEQAQKPPPHHSSVPPPPSPQAAPVVPSLKDQDKKKKRKKGEEDGEPSKHKSDGQEVKKKKKKKKQHSQEQAA